MTLLPQTQVLKDLSNDVPLVNGLRLYTLSLDCGVGQGIHSATCFHENALSKSKLGGQFAQVGGKLL